MSLDTKVTKKTIVMSPKGAKAIKKVAKDDVVVNDVVNDDVAKDVVNDVANVRPKRQCSQKQLDALAAGRAKNSRFKPKPLTTAN